MNLEYDYDVLDEDESFLSEVPINIIMSSIETQFNEPLEYRKKDYIKAFNKKYKKMVDETTEELSDRLENMCDEFYSFIKNIFYEKLSIGFNDIDNLIEDDIYELVHTTYRFFIKNMKKNYINVVKNYIKENQSEIENNFVIKKDVTAINFKAEIDNDYDVLVLSELGHIIDYIFDEMKNSDIDTFFKLCDDDEPCVELEFVKEKYDDLTLTGNFLPLYFDMLTPDFAVEIQSKIRNSILKKYPKRERKVETIEDLTKEDELENDEVNE